MKKVIFGTALASMALLSACSSDNELANAETTANNAIGFHVVGNKAETRATPITPDNITTTDFYVYAYIKNAEGKDGSPFMGGNDNKPGNNGINISYKSGNWSYTNPGDIRYWPTSDTKLNFYAVNTGSTPLLFSWKFTNTQKEISYLCYDEYSETNFYEEDGTKKQHLTNKDSMYAVAKEQTYDKNSGIVKFKFKHILSQVVFKAKTEYNNEMEVDINAVSIYNFQTGGTFKIEGEEPAQSNWTPNKTYPYNGEFTVKKVETGKNITVTKSDEIKDISDGPMLFVPQKLTKWTVPSTITAANTAKQSYLKITCKIKQGGAYLFGGDTTFDELFVPFGADWQPGKRYIYTLIFGGGYNAQGQAILKPIKFDSEVETWGEPDAKDINININK